MSLLRYGHNTVTFLIWFFYDVYLRPGVIILKRRNNQLPIANNQFSLSC
jgi:hypothetical protein